jgi:hypothetical protein
MRNLLNTTRLLASVVVPLLFACGSDTAVGGDTVSVPKCDITGQVLSTDSNGQFVCKNLPSGSLTLPTCKKYSEALTSNGTGVTCTNRNTQSQATTDALNNLESSETLINQYTTRLGKVTGGTGPAARAVYCGVTATTTNGKITSGAALGIAAASALCSQVAACGNTGRMCTVYDMYYSVASGAIKSTDSIPKSWVYMSAWQFSGAGGADQYAGLSDNCGSFTYPTGDRKWYGTAVTWANDTAGDKTLQFFSGPNGAACSAVLPIACCK